jgi:2-polyprenyl-3-methyl-5-hydroxy-6-metoxy-1,4-benzoquinol methylase
MESGVVASPAVAVPGYQQGKSYGIRECAGCGAVMATPLQSPAEIYQHIYTQPERIPGYARYAAYAKIVESIEQPLAYLASQEECYWAIADALGRYFPERSAKILEVGCGMGYLTASLRRAGYEQVLGIDLSSNAIDAARRRYGGFYREADVLTFATETVERFDVVVLSEVIEHLEDPQAVVAAACLLLKPQGILICTTPNRDFGGWARQHWATDLPPVHLWWLGERAMRALAQRCNTTMELTDFTEWNRRHYRRYQKALQRSRRAAVELTPMLDPEGRPLTVAPVHNLHARSRIRQLVSAWQNLLYRLKFSSGWRSEDIRRSPCLSVIFRNSVSHHQPCESDLK